MTVFTNTLLVDADPQTVFDILADRERELEWNPACESVTKLSSGPIGVGSRWRAKWKGGGPAVEVETLAYDRPNAVTSHNGGPLEVTVSCAFTPADGGTRADIRFEAIPHGFFRVVFPLFERRFRQQFAQNGERIKSLAEKRSVPLA